MNKLQSVRQAERVCAVKSCVFCLYRVETAVGEQEQIGTSTETHETVLKTKNPNSSTTEDLHSLKTVLHIVTHEGTFLAMFKLSHENLEEMFHN